MSLPRTSYVLGIETSCDDTACAVVSADGRVLASTVSSQLVSHRPYGGVVPEIASREHLRNWPAVMREALERAGIGPDQVGVVAATRGPGLIGALLVGLSVGRAFAWARGLPFHAVHHLEGHLYSPFLEPDGEPADPVPDRFVGLVVSGGHTALYQVAEGRVETVGETRDDAMGEAFDKLGKRVGLPYPQGPVVDRLAELGERKLRLPVPRCGETLDFSFSGLKTSAILEVEALERRGAPTDLGSLAVPEPVPGDDFGPALSLLAAFRHAAVRQVVNRLDRLQRARPFGLLAVSGGAAANRELRRELPAWAADHGVDLRLVPLVYSGDNAAMIAWAALQRERRGQRDDPLAVVAASRIPL